VPKKHILVIEDESSIADNLRYALTSEGFTCTWKAIGMEGIEIVNNESIDLVILDVGLPDISGFEVCKIIRKSSDVPIIFLTARGEEIDKVVGLEIGGDDYVTKPFSPRELVARVKVILKRQPTFDTTTNETTSLFSIDKEKRRIYFFHVELDLTSYEYGILQMLLNSPERVYTREQLMASVWSTPEESYDRAVDTHIKTLRAKLRAINANNNPLTTHRGVGYSIKTDA